MIRTGPASGVDRSGVIAVALPTIDFSGHVSALKSATGQTLESAPTFGASGGSSVTLADFVLASPGACSMTVVSGGMPPAPFLPVSPMVAESLGANGSASHAVGVKLASPSPVPPLAPVACSLVTAGPHDVGFVMKS